MTTVTRGAVLPITSDAVPIDGAAIDAVVGEVRANAPRWAATSTGKRAALLETIVSDTLAATDDWLADACRAKGLDPQSAEAGEELFAGIGTFVRMARVLCDSVRDIERTGRPQYPGPVREGPGGRLRVGVFPVNMIDRLLYPQTSAEVWMQPEVSRADVERGQAWAYRDPQAAIGVSLVLAAGNVASLGPRDVLYKMFVEGKVVVLKANPVNDYLVPHWSRAFASLIDAGFLRIVRGGAGVGAYLTNHPGIDEVHITGSDKTHDAIVFGSGEEGARHKAANEPQLGKAVSCELGNVSPVVIVPGQWSSTDLVYQAEHVATMLVNNAGFNCLSARVIVTHAGWPQREAFLGALTQALARIPTRRAYYPGAATRRQAFLDAHPHPVEVGRATEDQLPWTLIRGVEPTQTDDICFNVEAFCGVFAETALPASSPAAFVDAAVEFCNDVVWGSLSATVLAHPRSLREAEVANAVQRAVANLRYGGIGFNVWHGLVFALSTPTWGAYPGHPASDIQSGTGVVGNAYMFDRPEKSVVKGPFRARPKPPWFATNPNELAVMRRLLAFEGDPSVRRLPGLFAAALRP